MVHWYPHAQRYMQTYMRKHDSVTAIISLQCLSALIISLKEKKHILFNKMIHFYNNMFNFQYSNRTVTNFD